MYKQFYKGMELAHLPLFTLVLFLAVFLGVVAWAFFLRKGRDFESVAALPLDLPSPARPAAIQEEGR